MTKRRSAKLLKRATSGIIILLLIGSLIAILINVQHADGQISNTNLVEKKISVKFPLPTILDKQGYDWLTLENCSYITTPGSPMLPVKTITAEIPESSTIINVNIDSNHIPMQGDFNVLPVSVPVTTNSQNTNTNINATLEIYGSNAPFPKETYVYHEGQGLSSETASRVKYLIFNLFPLQYLPLNKTIIRAEEMTITMQYTHPIKALDISSANLLKNLIITSPTLQPYAVALASWKNQTGIPSKVVNTTIIYQLYTGVDNPEKIRNCIKDYVSTYGIIYATIFGDVDQVPIRYASVNDSEAGEFNVPTDLYYADLTGSWDDNHDGVYADQRYDNVDGIPDVYVGRIPVSSTTYAQAVVNKIIGYQQQVIYNPSPNDWTQKYFTTRFFKKNNSHKKRKNQ